ncbi:transforming growth factor beta activator LRRC32 isoform X1 [Osmerus mordax]|uniref:transforming growth factor beta activator LRRC32 isoform X1 n=2 Tax=Osmerus mordax TaxID=8014 RepID=UPI00350FC061
MAQHFGGKWRSHSCTMSGSIWLLLVLTSPLVASFLPLRQLAPCEVIEMDASCTNLNLETVPDKLPEGIQKIDLSWNILQNLTQEGLAFYSSIHHLNLHSNKIQFIQPGLFKDMTSLKVLNLSRNYLDVFAVSKTHVGPLTAVEMLDLSGNGLFTGMTDYFLCDAPALLNLSLNSNSITKIAQNTFCGSLALRRIDFHNNVILEIENGAFDSLLQLSELDLSMNSISCIADFNLSQLKVLNLSKNSMESFQTTDSDLEYELLYLDLRENRIHYFPLIPRRNKLMYLDVSRNRLRSINTTGTAEEMELLRDVLAAPGQSAGSSRHQDFSRLVYLDMSYNQIKSIPKSFFCSMVSLEVLNVSNNCLGAFLVDQETPMNLLKTLDLSFNALQNFSLGLNSLRSLEELFLQGNFLQTIHPATFQTLPCIRYLHLQQNYLKVCATQRKPPNSPEADFTSHNPPGCVSFSSIPTLHFLYLSQNSLEALPPYAFYGTPLRLLDLSLNPGLEMHDDALSGLENSLSHLSLKENHMPELKPDLSLLGNLKFVDLSANKLTTFPLWNKQSSIESLNLQNNSLVTVQYETVVALERSLKVLYVGSNPLGCCSNLPFLLMLQQAAVTVPDIATATCLDAQGPEPVERNIGSVTQEQCQTLSRSWIIIVVVMMVVLIVALALIVKVCLPRKRRFNSSFKA